jgi:AmmeMemoRadiSam system protein B
MANKLEDESNTIDDIPEDLQVTFRTTLATLSESYFLDDERFHAHRQHTDTAYQQQTLRKPAHAGIAYPDNAQELTTFIQDIVATETSENQQKLGQPIGIYAPHIDFRVSTDTYSGAYQALRESSAQRFIIIATSHYGTQDLIIPTYKDFETPLGVVANDRAFVEEFRNRLSFTVTENDVAHRPENSIEFHVPFLQVLFPERDITIVPLLVTSFFHYLNDEVPPEEEERFLAITQVLRELVEESDVETAFIVSGDLSHIGKKFGDVFDASERLRKIHHDDHTFMEAATRCSKEQVFAEMKRTQDRNRICGFPPLYTFLETARPSIGQQLHYEQWYEQPTSSAVTFGSIAFYQNK